MASKATNVKVKSDEIRRMKDRPLTDAIELYRRGQVYEARKSVGNLLIDDPKNIEAWFWMSNMAEDDAERRTFLEMALRIDPQNKIAKRGLRDLARKSTWRSSSTRRQGKLPEDSAARELARGDPGTARSGAAPIKKIKRKPNQRENGELALAKEGRSGSDKKSIRVNDRPSPSPENRSGAWIFALGVALIVLIIGSCAGGTSSSKKCDEAAAYVAAKSSVRSQLKAPSSARFPFATTGHVIKSGNSYKISSWVEAENSFGASLRVPWTASVRIDSNGRCKLQSVGVYD